MTKGFFDQDFFQLLLGSNVDSRPRYQIKCNYESSEHRGGFFFILPYEYTSEQNARAALSIFRDFDQDDLTLLMNEHSQRRNAHFIKDSVKFVVSTVRT